MQTQPYTETRRRPTGAKPVTPQTKIQMAFDAAEGDRQEAAQRLIELAEDDVSLAAHLIYVGARTAVGDLMRSDRATAYRGVQTDVTRTFLPMPSQAGHAAHAHRVSRRASLEVLLLLETTIFGGKIKMGDATKEDLLESSAKYRMQANGATHKALHGEAVAARIPAGKKTREVMDDAALTALWHETGRGLGEEIAA